MGYLAERNGSTRYKDKIVNYKKGWNDLKKGVLDHVGSCHWYDTPPQEPVRTTNVKAGEADNRANNTQNTTSDDGVSVDYVPTSDNTVAEIKAYLDDEGIDYKSNMNKADLLELANQD